MKLIKIVIVLLLSAITYTVSAQDINQLDANGKRHGVWRKNFKKTRILRYEGEFNHGKEMGVFKFYKNLDSKAVLTATRTFNPNNDVAEVKFLSSSKRLISEGKMRGKTYIGKWIYYHKKSSVVMTEERYSNRGELEGERNTYYKTGKIAEKAIYQSGKLEGASIWYSGNGNILKDNTYVNGKLHGLAKTYDFKGNLESEGVFQNNRKHGIWKFYKHGKFVKEKDFTRRSNNPNLKMNKQ